MVNITSPYDGGETSPTKISLATTYHNNSIESTSDFSNTDGSSTGVMLSSLQNQTESARGNTGYTTEFPIHSTPSQDVSTVVVDNSFNITRDRPADNGVPSARTELVVGLVVGLIVIAGIVVFVVVILWRKRRFGSKVASSGRTSEIKPNQRATWHDQDDTEDTSINIPDIELQPSHIFDSHGDIHSKSDTIERLHTDVKIEPGLHANSPLKETMVFDSKSISFKLKEQYQKGETDGDVKDIERYGAPGEAYTLVRRQSNKDTGHGPVNYQFVGPVDSQTNAVVDAITPQKDGNKVQQTQNTVQIVDENNGKDYVEMKIENEDSDSETEDDIYTNNAVIRASTSVENHDLQTEINVPKRAASEIVHGSGLKAPVPQPRLSLKKTIDPYDYPPKRTFNRETLRNSSGDKIGETEQSDSDDSSESSTDSTNDMYTFPVTSGDARVMSVDEYLEETVYDVPPRRASE